MSFLPTIRPSVRLRLTLTYTGLFLVAGAGLLTVNYFLVSHREHKSGTAYQIVCQPGTADLSLVQGQLPVSPLASPVPNGCSRTQVKTSGFATGAIGGAIGGAIPGATQPPGSPSSPSDATSRLAALANVAVQAQDHTLHTLQVESALALGLMAIASLGLGWLIAGRALRPVHRITNTARRLSEETLHERINLDGPDDELKELADTFDAMLGRLDHAFAGQRRFVANASHELRTPLAIDRVLIDEALANRRARPEELRSILEDLRANNEQTERLIDALLVLARSQQDVHRWLASDLGTVAGRTLEQARAEAVTAGVEIRTDLATAPATGDPALLERLAGNLIDNGIRHNLPAGGWLEIATGVAGGRPRLRVANSGRVLAPEHVPALFEPFRREGPDRTSSGGGFGLGLSIVQSVVEAHGGRLDAAARPDGGLEVVVVLPAARSLPRPPSPPGPAPEDVGPSGRSSAVGISDRQGGFR